MRKKVVKKSGRPTFAKATVGRPKQKPAKVAVKRSAAGLGLFAAEPIKKNRFVVEYKGRVLSDEAAQYRDTKYLFEVNRKWTIDGSSRANKARYINHSCKPNCEPEIYGKRVKIYAIKNIKPGDELAYDYGKEYWKHYIKPKGCRCVACK